MNAGGTQVIWWNTGDLMAPVTELLLLLLLLDAAEAAVAPDDAAAQVWKLQMKELKGKGETGDKTANKSLNFDDLWILQS